MSTPTTGNGGFSFKGQTLQLGIDGNGAVLSGVKSASNALNFYIDGISNASTASNTGTIPTQQLCLGARGASDTTVALAVGGLLLCAGVTVGMNSTQAASLAANVRRLMIKLGRLP